MWYADRMYRCAPRHEHALMTDGSSQVARSRWYDMAGALWTQRSSNAPFIGTARSGQYMLRVKPRSSGTCRYAPHARSIVIVYRMLRLLKCKGSTGFDGMFIHNASPTYFTPSKAVEHSRIRLRGNRGVDHRIAGHDNIPPLRPTCSVTAVRTTPWGPQGAIKIHPYLRIPTRKASIQFDST